ncbi:helix-turn-helix transcriptional regulator [Spirosoma agri]|uniref:Helix-turn-helix transcriptional regulator n=1 Tax=Spirosoma agri TaxID=1987381 RepID=A0A6M0IHE9_9BACT|nr:helix-turn-helix transcriptional regulator [Spirosoma agri]NEU67706.1 helix-turn-helix transcriptional regulator [Spirosoma agri]
MTINDKIKQILIDKNLSPSYFADEIGVQRSSISHILSGRNRPSFDIIQKIIRRFPELGYEWIMEEDNQTSSQPIPTGYTARSVTRTPDQDRMEGFTYPAPQPIGVRSQRTEIPPSAPAQPTSSSDNSAEQSVGLPLVEKKVERILIFYTDGSFREYTPTV